MKNVQTSSGDKDSEQVAKIEMASLADHGFQHPPRWSPISTTTGGGVMVITPAQCGVAGLPLFHTP